MRIFYICSYGGCASKMLCRFLSKYYVVYHIHSRFPPNKLTSIKKTPLYKRYEWFDYNNILNKKTKNLITVIYLYRKPSTSLLSSQGWGSCHCSNIGLNIRNPYLKLFFNKNDITRFRYSKIKKDLFGLNNFFKNYTIKKHNKNYNIICIKYETLWENLDKIFRFLNIPDEIKEKFPKKYEKKLNKIQLETKNNLSIKYRNLETIIDTMPPIFINKC